METTRKYIVQPVFLHQFMGQLGELNPSKLFYGPVDIFGQAKRKMTLEELIPVLSDYSHYWFTEIGEETLFYISLEYSDAYSIEMKNSGIDEFDPYDLN